MWVVAVSFVMDHCPEYPIKPQNALESYCTECQWSDELVAPGGADDLVLSPIMQNKE